MVESGGIIRQVDLDANLGLPTELQGKLTPEAQKARRDALVARDVTLEEANSVYPFDPADIMPKAGEQAMPIDENRIN